MSNKIPRSNDDDYSDQINNLRITPQQMHYGQGISTTSALLTNSSNNAAHPANGLAALKLAEIAAALTVAGELSLGAASKIDRETRKNEWVDAHEQLGRNR